MPLDNSDGNRLGALGIVHALGLDARALRPGMLELALPVGKFPILRWRLPEDVRDNPDAIDDYPRSDLEGFARQLGEADPYRLELRDMPSWQEAGWFLRTIGEADLLLPKAVYLRDEPRFQPLIWQWPLRIGFLQDAASVHLYGLLEDGLRDPSADWRPKTIRLVPPAEVPTQCGLVLVPSVPQSRDELSSAAPGLRCGAVLLFNWDPMAEPPAATARGLLRSAWTSGVLLSEIDDPSASADFCFTMIRELTHNYTLDAALVSASKAHGLPYPLMFGSTALMRDSRLSRVMGRMTRSMESPRMRGISLDQAGDAGQAFPMSGSMEDIAHTARGFEVSEDVFAHEGDFSVAMADLGEALAERMRREGTSAQAAPPRFLQCQVTQSSDDPPEPAKLTDYFRPGEAHRAEIRIGRPDNEWLQPSGDSPFPTEELPQELGDWPLTVAFSVLSGDAIPKTGAVELPSKQIRLLRAGGNSTTCSFDFEVPDGDDTFTARVLVLYRDRVLQTGILSGPVGGPSTGKITFEIEALVSRFFSGLRQSPRFTGALLFNDNDDGNTGMTGVSEGVVRITAPEGLAEQFDKLNDRVSKMAYEAEIFTGKLEENEELCSEMIALAREGADIRDVIEEHIAPGSGFDKGAPIQVVAKAMGKKIPIEFFYDYRAPRSNAELCPGAAASLASEDGRCDLEHSSKVFCPSGFWGLNRVIEHHAFKAGSTQEDFELRNEPIRGRETLPIGRKALFAGTKVVDDALGPVDGLAKIKTQLDALTENRCKQVASWADWETEVGSDAPSLLVLLVHTETSSPPIREQQLEIGDGDWLLYNDIYPEVVGGDADPGPLLFLIGCETGAAEISFKSLCEKFKRRGASLVVSSNATIHSRHAVPVLEALIEALGREIGGAPVPFGEIMPRVRRQMLAAGIPIILCITAYGDASWVLT